MKTPDTRLNKLQEWMDKQDAHQKSSSKIMALMWEDAIKILRRKINNGCTFEDLSIYIKSLRDRFVGEHRMAGPHAAKHVYSQIYQKMWSLNKK